MVIQLIALKPLNPLLPRQCKNSISQRRGSQLSVSAAESVAWEEQIPPNAVRRKRDPSWRGGFSLGVDLGVSRTGVAISKGFTVRPLTVLELRGQKLELRLLDLAEKQEVDEFIIGLPKSSDGKETQQSNKVRSVAGRFAVRAAERGWRVYLQDEHGTSSEALDHMIAKGVSKSVRDGKLDAYAAMKVLERYYSEEGKGIEVVVPKQLELRNKLREGPPKDIDFYSPTTNTWMEKELPIITEDRELSRGGLSCRVKMYSFLREN